MVEFILFWITGGVYTIGALESDQKRLLKEKKEYDRVGIRVLVYIILLFVWPYFLGALHTEILEDLADNK